MTYLRKAVGLLSLLAALALTTYAPAVHGAEGNTQAVAADCCCDDCACETCDCCEDCGCGGKHE